MNTILWSILFLVIGIVIGVKIAVAVANAQVKQGRMFFERGGRWYGDAEAMRRMIAKRKGKQ
jgi:hypothetical protein